MSKTVFNTKHASKGKTMLYNFEHFADFQINQNVLLCNIIFYDRKIMANKVHFQP